jgi:hypothetical protein
MTAGPIQRKDVAVEPAEFFQPWEGMIASWDDALASIRQVIDLATENRDLAWRGVANANYALHSSIYRWLGRDGSDVTEAKVVKAEASLLDRARRRWRFDGISSLEIFAQIQHFGGPSRPLDVSFNPLVALWFAVEQRYTNGMPADDIDGRLFVFDVSGHQIELDDVWGGRELPWKDAPNGWGTELPRIWRPPSLNDRIPAQNSAFLMGGVPKTTSGSNARYRISPGDGTAAPTWKIGEVRQATSVTVFMNRPDRALRSSSRPTFTFRIEAGAKLSIRRYLENRFGFNTASMYPDLFGLAQHVSNCI